MRWKNIRTICFRETRDQLRDRRTVFILVLLPILLYPAMGIGMLQFAVLFSEQPIRIGIVGLSHLQRAVPAADDTDQFYLPQLPPLVDGNHFHDSLFENQPGDRASLIVVTGDEDSLKEMLALGEIQACLVFTNKWAQTIRSGRRAILDIRLPGDDDGPRVKNLGPDLLPTERDWEVSAKTERSELAYSRVRSVMLEWEEQIINARMTALRSPRGFANPMTIPELQLADRAERAWVRMFPFLIIMMALTGALYPAIDVCAGEKERGTMETLLISPVKRSEIVWGKFLTVWLFSAITALLNLGSLGLTAWHFSTAAEPLLQAAGESTTIIPTPGLAAFGWCVVLLVPLAAFLSACCLALAVYARSTKEGQYYLMPMMLIVMPLTLLSAAPGVELSGLYSMLPITGASLLMQELMTAKTAQEIPWLYIGPVLVPLAAYCYISLRWAVIQFNREDVLFREAAKLDFTLWLRHLLRDKEPLPTPTEALTCFGIILMLMWFSLSIATRTDPITFIMIQQAAFIAAPAVIMAVVLTSKPRMTLRLFRPEAGYLGLAALLALSMHVPIIWAVKSVEHHFPQMAEQMKAFSDALISQETHPLKLLAALALFPAVCEELAFRGFIQSGMLRHMKPGKAIIASSLLFALAHLDAFRFLVLLLLGLVLGLLALRSGSLLPGIVFHLVNNGTAVTVSMLHEAGSSADVLPEWLQEENLYSGPVALAFLAVALGLLIVLYRSRPPK